jgi:hypothetical protein
MPKTGTRQELHGAMLMSSIQLKGTKRKFSKNYQRKRSPKSPRRALKIRETIALTEL